MNLAIQFAKQHIAMIITAAFALSLFVTPAVLAVPQGAACNANVLCDGGLACVNGICAAGVAGGGAGSDVFGVNPIKNNTKLGTGDVRVTISSIINVALGLLGTVAVVIILAAGFQWMTAGGNDEKVAGAKKLMISGVIGLAIIMSAFAISKFVINELGVATSVKDFQRIE